MLALVSHCESERNTFICCHQIFYRHSWSQEIKPRAFFQMVIMKVTFLTVSEISLTTIGWMDTECDHVFVLIAC